MAKLTILRGVSGCGKSTWARQQNAKVVSRDDLRVILFPGENEKDYYEVPKEVFFAREQEVSIAQDAMVAAFLKAGKDVIVDNTNIEWKFVTALAKIGYKAGAEVEVKVFDVDLKTAIARNAGRASMGGRDVKRDIIEKQHSRFQGNKTKTLDPVFVPRPYTGTPGKPKAFLFDLDGTTYHMGDKRSPYDHNVDVDDPDDIIQDIVATLSVDYLPIAMSGRVEATREKTEFALNRDDVPFYELFMRADGDMRADNIVKAELFDKYVRDNFDVQFVLDDRNQVVEMWRSMGLSCLQVAEGDF